MTTGRALSRKDLAYEAISERWAGFISDYDTERRVETLVDELLGEERIRERSCLDAGCGLGRFSEGLLAFEPASVLSIDLAPSLVEKVAERLPVEACVGDLLNLEESLGQRQFDVVLSSEVIEHTPNPEQAVKGLCARVAPGGHLVLSCPNRRWKWLLHMVRLVGMRRDYEGYENWVWPGALVRWVEESGLEVEAVRGIHAVPWQGVPNSLLRTFDRRYGESLYGIGINLALRARRPEQPGEERRS